MSSALCERGRSFFSHSLFDLIGMGTDHVRGRIRSRLKRACRYAGLIAQRPHSGSALRGILRDYFSAPVAIDQCVGDWYELEGRPLSSCSPRLNAINLGKAPFSGTRFGINRALPGPRIGR